MPRETILAYPYRKLLKQSIQMGKQSKLSICIPTFNRAALLKECLESFLPHAVAHNTELLVDDNRSDDGTLEILQGLAQSIPVLRYQISEKREPLWTGITRSVLMASSEFCWLFSDDDRISGDAIGRVLAAIDSGAKAVVVNGTTMSKDFSQTIEERRIPIDKDSIYLPGMHQEFLVNTAFYLSFLGGLVVHRETFLKHQAAMTHETYFRHVASFLTYCPSATIYVIAEPYVQIRLQNSVWSSRRFEVLMIDWPRCMWSLSPEYSRQCKASVVDECRMASIPDMLGARAFGMLTPEVFRDQIKESTAVPALKKLIVRLISKAPRRLLKGALVSYLFLLRPKGFRLLLHDLVNS